MHKDSPVSKTVIVAHFLQKARLIVYIFRLFVKSMPQLYTIYINTYLIKLVALLPETQGDWKEIVFHPGKKTKKI